MAFRMSSVSNGRRDTITDSSKKVRNVGFGVRTKDSGSTEETHGLSQGRVEDGTREGSHVVAAGQEKGIGGTFQTLWLGGDRRRA